MRFHNVSSYVPEGELDARMNAGGGDGRFGVVDLGQSEVCLDSREDAVRLHAATARILGWFDAGSAPHIFASLLDDGIPYGPCRHCGQIKRAAIHTETAQVAA